jgi:hypothetical protein
VDEVAGEMRLLEEEVEVIVLDDSGRLDWSVIKFSRETVRRSSDAEMLADVFWKSVDEELSSLDSCKGGAGGGGEVGFDFLRLGRLITSSTRGVIICQDMAISAVAPYKLKRSVLEYLTSAEAVRTLS